MFSLGKSTTLGALLLGVAVLGVVTQAAGQGTRGAPPTRAPEARMFGAEGGRGAPTRGGGVPGASNETYTIVEVGQEYQVVPKSGMNDLKKRVNDDYQTALKTYNEAKKDKNNKGVTLEKPEKKNYNIKTIKSSIKTQEEAQNLLAKLEQERNKNGGSKSLTGGKKNANW